MTSETHLVSQRPPLVRVDLNEQAYEVLRERIVSRTFAPRQRLSLQVLADELGVSRSPVHQALTRLVSDGLVIVSRRGYSVRPVTRELLRETHQARLALEEFAVREAAGAVPAERLAALQELLAATVAPVAGEVLVDPRAYLIANRAFHEALVDLPGNSIVSELYRRLNVHQLLDRAVIGLASSAAGRSTVEHTEIVAAVEAGAAARAARAVRANVETGLRLTLEALEVAGGEL